MTKNSSNQKFEGSEFSWNQKIFGPKFLQALLGEQGLTVCWFCVCLCFWDNFSASDWSKYGDVARRRETSYGVARLLLMVPLEPWRNSTPVFGAAAFCTTKIGNFRTSPTLSSLTTWSTYSSKRRPLRKDQLGGTICRFSPSVWNIQRRDSPYI